MTLPTNDAGTLRRILALLAPTLTPEERSTAASRVEGRITEQDKSALAFRFTQLGILAHPTNAAMARAFADALQVAFDAGELTSKLPPHEKGAFVSDLIGWLKCPEIAEDSPLRDWLPNAPVAEPPEAAPVALEAKSEPEWVGLARARAPEIKAEYLAKDWHPTVLAIAELIAEEFRKATPPTHGAQGKPLTGEYIKRHALTGIFRDDSEPLST
jgi:hypothetical protein